MRGYRCELAQLFGESEVQGCEEQEPGNQAGEVGVGGPEQDETSDNRPGCTDQCHGPEQTATRRDVAAIDPGRGNCSRPEKERGRGVGGDRRDAGKEKGGEDQECAAAREGIDCAPEDGRCDEENEAEVQVPIVA